MVVWSDCRPDPVGVAPRTVLVTPRGAGASLFSRARSAAVPTVELRERVVVVGSGFGGGVAALRLARAGVSALVLERGTRWPTGPDAQTFPRFVNPDRRASWLSPWPVMPLSPPRIFRPYTGMFEKITGSGMTIYCAAAVGGGSVAYHGMTLQPTQANFARSMPTAAGDYDELAAVHYPTVARMLRVATIPDDLLNTDNYRSSRLFLEAVDRIGLQPFRVPLPVDWDYARAELRGQMRSSYTTSDLFYGVNNGGKHSIDVTYLAAAEATGHIRIAPLHVVRDISLDRQRRWVLDVDRINTRGVVQEHKRIVTDAVFLAAGSAGTTRLLVKARAKNLIPDLPEAVGSGWGANGDRVWAWTGMHDRPGRVQGGPACVGGRDWDGDLPHTLVHSGTPLRLPNVIRLMTVIGFGIVPGVGTWSYDPAADDAHLTWPDSGDTALLAKLRTRVDDLTRTCGGVVGDTNARRKSTWHPLGGVPMGSAVDRVGRVLGHRGLYVLDGARIPGSTGACNPSMTIAALAEHSMTRIVQHDVGDIF
ncbi:MAG TPA: GMC oxidoreductase [Rugosimonospora sp.]|nr:GMC oxidoreductase [Rugosimonospora sp.]